MISIHYILGDSFRVHDFTSRTQKASRDSLAMFPFTLTSRGVSHV